MDAGEAVRDELSWEEFLAHAYEAGWTDGLPVIPPTRARVDAMLAAVGASPEQSLGALPPRMAELTMERVAANAVMAGCTPEYMPIVVAALTAVASEPFNAQAVQPTTNPVGPLIIVNGPIAGRVGVHAGSGCLGPGFRANATIGRAVRLAMINVGGATPALVDRATHGFPGKFTFCVAENEQESPFEPFHVRRGFAASDSVVSTFQACGFLNMVDQSSPTPEELLTTIAGSIRPVGSNNLMTGRGALFLLLGPKHARVLTSTGWTVEDIQDRLFARTRIPMAEIPPAFRRFICRRREIDPAEPDIPVARSPRDIEIIVAGGAGNHSVFVPGFADGEVPSVEVPSVQVPSVEVRSVRVPEPVAD